MHANMLSSSPGSQASPSTTSGGGPNMTPNASLAGSITPSSLATVGSTTAGAVPKSTTGGASESLSGPSSIGLQPSTGGSGNASKQTSTNKSTGGSTGATVSAAGNKKVFENNDVTCYI